MKEHFESSEYIKHIANELIRNFAFSSSATTPVLIGSAREKEVIRKLEMLLPKSVGIGSGCIIDSYGNTSKQMDIVLYEKDFCPVFCINESSETTYFPCEGVVAVGEVKSSLNSKELSDIFKKIESVKKLKRHSVPEKSMLRATDCYAFRHYGVKGSFEPAQSEDFDQENKSTDQIYCFAVCGTLDLTLETLAQKFEEELKTVDYKNEVNLITILDYGLIFYYDQPSNMIKNTFKETGAFFITSKRENNFEFLLSKLNWVIDTNRTVNFSAFNRYILLNNSVSLLGGIHKKINSR